MSDSPVGLETTGVTSGLRFKLEVLIGRGSFGLVYRAVQLGLNRPVALKLLNADALGSTEQVGRFLNEARVTASLTHPHIVAVIDHGVAGEQPWIAYEYLSGPTLRALIPAHGLAWLRAIEIGAQVGAALAEAHRQSVIHRDVKPENVMEAEPGHFKVTDFGLAKWNHRAAFRTASASVIGTPAYFAPEFIATAAATPATDQYALGVLVYELLTGRTPFTGESAAAIVEQHLKATPTPPSKLTPGIPPAVDRLVLTALAKNPRERHASVDELTLQLAGFANRSQEAIDLAAVLTPAEPSTVRKSSFKPASFALPVAIVAGAFLASWAFHPAPAPPVLTSSSSPSVVPISRMSATEPGEMRAQLTDILARADARATRTTTLAAYLNPLFLRLADAAPEAAALETEIRADQRTLTVLRERILAYYPEPERVPPPEQVLLARLLVNAARGWCWLENMSNTRVSVDAALAARGDQAHDSEVLSQIESRPYSAGGDAFVAESARAVHAALSPMESHPELSTPEVADLLRELYWLGSITGFRGWPAEAHARLREVPRLIAPAPGDVLCDAAAAVWELGHAKLAGARQTREAARVALGRLAASPVPYARQVAERLDAELTSSSRATAASPSPSPAPALRPPPDPPAPPR